MSARPVVPLRQIAADGLARNNQIGVRLLALCPMLAVSVSLPAAATLGALTLLVMTAAGALVAALRPATATAARLPLFLIVVAVLVALADLATAAFAPALWRELGIFLPLIITNCAVLARLELFAGRQTPLAAAADGFFCGAGMLACLAALAAAREFVANGQVVGLPPQPLFAGIPAAALPVGGFFLFALLLVALRKLKITPPD